MGLVFLVVVGGILGWLAAIVMRADGARDVALNVAAGIAGALLTGLVVGPLLGFGNILEGRYNVDALLASLGGTIVLLLAINLFRDRELR